MLRYTHREVLEHQELLVSSLWTHTDMIMSTVYWEFPMPWATYVWSHPLWGGETLPTLQMKKRRARVTEWAPEQGLLMLRAHLLCRNHRPPSPHSPTSRVQAGSPFLPQLLVPASLCKNVIVHTCSHPCPPARGCVNSQLHSRRCVLGRTRQGYISCALGVSSRRRWEKDQDKGWPRWTHSPRILRAGSGFPSPGAQQCGTQQGQRGSGWGVWQPRDGGCLAFRDFLFGPPGAHAHLLAHVALNFWVCFGKAWNTLRTWAVFPSQRSLLNQAALLSGLLSPPFLNPGGVSSLGPMNL